MQWEKLFDMQQKLDQYIQSNHNVSSEEIFDHKILALFVELGELANETRTFKFWSVKEASSKSVLLEEFVDNIHFLLSLGLDDGHKPASIDHMPYEGDLTGLFNQLYRAIDYYRDDRSIASYLTVFGLYLTLGDQLGFSDQSIQQAYIDKNEVNYKRQDENY
ncbi:Dimeric dUTPase, all-alpha-NTP-PPase (MazG) superfamily [Pelagirhabdus alkalitolerans]|uniref:Dimeric dUTPase, all-alpha-NTP-PPase (MazG) superfamily n=1 Tax=Pelagirhabdus alkalitolerans TaxID=1612202 RepID=A0A1G6HLC2_9BACI|nr:dUTP diphosphatase [Pelagirhabdus alkalitolerans]SDB94918.1 Dimeric dUTPase, all-alpha-NTP-PPase (MazG) superfamily [Pelagirhabdus alkalitolerans]